MSTRSAESRENSPGDSPEKRASKKRKVLSCYACRNRKMKCDRVYPVCGRCRKTGRADQCTYDPRLIEDLPLNGDGHVPGGLDAGFHPPPTGNNSIPSFTSTPSESLLWKMRVQERRLDGLERRLDPVDRSSQPFSSELPSRLGHADACSDEPIFDEGMMFRGKSFKTQFYGSTSPFSQITQFSELEAFTREAMMADSSLVRIRADFKTLKTRRKAYMKENDQKAEVGDAELLSLVPEKSIAEIAAIRYFETFEDCYRVLHQPTFWNEFHTFWDQKQKGADVSLSFAAILVLVLAITKCLSTDQENEFVGDSSAAREMASNLVDSCDAWLVRHSRKHLTVAFFQLQCLALLAKRVNCVRLKQDWVHSGDAIRIAVAAGMHRDPSLLTHGKISEFDKEMRRRIWATLAELELQSSIDCGLQSSLVGLYVDTEPPTNIPDDAFGIETGQMPAGRPQEHFTSASYLAWSIRSRQLRIHLMQLLNNPTTELHYTDVLHYDAQITSFLSTLPSWDESRAVMASALLNMQLRQFLLMLHRPYAMLAKMNPRFAYSLTACVNAANSLIMSHEGLSDKGNLALNFMRNDLVRASMTLAQVIYHNSSFPPNLSPQPSAISSTNGPIAPEAQPIDTGGPKNSSKYSVPPLRLPELPTNDFMTRTICITGIELMGRARALFERKVLRLGTAYMENWLLSVALGLMPSTSTTKMPVPSSMNSVRDEIHARGREAVNHITNMCFRVLGMQKDPEGNLASSLRSTVTYASPPELRSSASTVIVPSALTPLDASVGPGGMPTLIPGVTGLAGALDEGMKVSSGLQEPWDGLQDMQVDLTGWDFPDFWSFGIGEDF